MSRFTLRRTVGAAVGVAALVGGVLAAPTSAVAAGSTSTYYKAVPACAPATAGHSSCFALRRVKVSANTPGAVKAAKLPRSITYGPDGGFTPSDLAGAYSVHPATAVTQTVGVVDAYDDPDALADLNHFDETYNLPDETASTFEKVSQTGSTTTLPAADTTGWSVEESLDLDAVRGLCHHCKIILVESDSNSNDDLGAGVNEAVALGATEVSNSYGGAEDGTDTAAQNADYNHPGVVITASTADDGYYDWDNFNYNYAATAPPDGTQTTSSNAPASPASLNTVVAVGGTTLQLNDDGTRSGESVWNENGTFDNTGFYAGAPQGATGGGCSTEFTAQPWQSSVANYALTGCGTKRLSGDVSALADPYTGYDIYDTYAFESDFQPGWATYGGTSLSSPLVAAMWALAGGSGGVTYPSLSLYGHFDSTPSSLYDVTVGGNGYCDGTSAGECGNGFPDSSPNALGAGLLDCAWSDDAGTPNVGTRACDAAVGYDGPSGVGTPNGVTAFKAMSPTAIITTPKTISAHTTGKYSGRTSTDPFPGGSIATYSWNFGDHTAIKTPAPTHIYEKAGQYTITLRVTDTYGRAATVTKTVTVK